VPPVNPWFICISELEQKPYDKTKAQLCLDSILSHPEIEKGTFSLSKDHNLLTFSLESPTLVVTDLDLDVPPKELARFQELFSANEAVNGQALHVGEPYTRRRESQVWFGVDLFLRSEGRRAGVSRTLRLDYSTKRAQVAYRVWDAPRREPEPLGPVFGTHCPILNANFNGFDLGRPNAYRIYPTANKDKMAGMLFRERPPGRRGNAQKNAFLERVKNLSERFW
jgi:hypothetical protein